MGLLEIWETHDRKRKKATLFVVDNEKKKLLERESLEKDQEREEALSRLTTIMTFCCSSQSEMDSPFLVDNDKSFICNKKSQTSDNQTFTFISPFNI